jgi:hypothetical protein
MNGFSATRDTIGDYYNRRNMPAIEVQLRDQGTSHTAVCPHGRDDALAPMKAQLGGSLSA